MGLKHRNKIPDLAGTFEVSPETLRNWCRQLGIDYAKGVLKEDAKKLERVLFYRNSGYFTEKGYIAMVRDGVLDYNQNKRS